MNGDNVRAISILRSIRNIALDVGSSIGASKESVIEAMGMAIGSLDRPTPAPGALPELLPLPEWSKRDDLGGLVASDIRVAIHAYAITYARAYAEQCRAGVRWNGSEVRPRQDAMLALFIGSPSDGGPEIRQGRFDAPFGFIDSTTAMRIDPDAWAYAPPALQSAFADDEGVK